jgi:thioredoxin
MNLILFPHARDCTRRRRFPELYSLGTLAWWRLVCKAGAVPFSLAAPFTPVLRSRSSWRESVPNILLLVSPSCGACPSAKSLWKQLRVKYSFSYREVDITTDDGRSLADRHSVRAVPATIIDGRLTFVGVPSRESAEKALLLKMKPRE